VPNNWGWRRDVEEDNESPIDDAAVAETERRIAELQSEFDALYDSPWWELYEAKVLEPEFATASNVMMAVDNDDELRLARERARVISRLRKKPQALTLELAEQRKLRRILLGEEADPEEE
jgi:hypothetical protein